MSTSTTASIEKYLGKNVHLLPQTRQLRALHTVIRNKHASTDEFVFFSQRIIRMLIESALNLLPFEDLDVETPVGRVYQGLRFSSKICGISVIRAGESMENVLRDVCGPIRIGKILIQRHKVTKSPHLFYSNVPADIAQRQVLLLEPMLATAGSAIAAIEVLLEKTVPVDNIILVNFIAAPEGISAICEKYPKLKMVTSAIEEGLNENAYMLPGIGDFGDRFFGSDRLTVSWNHPVEADSIPSDWNKSLQAGQPLSHYS